ncbi:MAG TPA: PP2C family protein-serine/threonine phosphatase [Mycobacteriales bacterium]|nr:PP2C family protein-serine/threonine phosphatase [Mycobacteriales bacterium]
MARPLALPARFTLALLVGLAVLICVAGSAWSAELFPPALQSVPLLVGGLTLTTVPMRLLDVAVGLCLLASIAMLGISEVRPGALVAVGVAGLLAERLVRSRTQTGLSDLRGGGVLVELRERLRTQGDVPALPPGWLAEVVLKPAGGGPFAGDFLVSRVDRKAHLLELALVDVSGKGVDAGTRALLLSGALGGLLGALPPGEFLPAANRYLYRQDWEDGFATAVHLVVDLSSGRFVVESAGHPPVARYDGGSGRWSLLERSGLVLGIVPDVAYEQDSGHLHAGDALLLYTDGLVESSGRDLSVGIDKLLGEAERLVTRGFRGGAELLVRRVAAGGADDRGLVLIARLP